MLRNDEGGPSVRLHVWRAFPEELLEPIRTACGDAWKKSRHWNHTDLQRKLETEMRSVFGHSSVHGNVPLADLGVSRSKAEIDIVVRGTFGGLLVQVAGHQLPRHEKELLECMSVSIASPEFSRAVFVVCSSNRLTLEGRRSSFDYCSGALLSLAEPALSEAGLEGLLILGLPTPASPL